MTPSPHDVIAAQLQAAGARRQLFGTLAEVQDRLKPSHLAQDAVESAAQGIATAARRGAASVRSRPFAVATVVGAIGLVMARGWIGKVVRGRNETPDGARGLNDKTAKPAKKGSIK